MRDRAEELAQLILPAFGTLSGVPVGRLRIGDPRPYSSGMVILAEAGSMTLEYTRLWQVTGNRTYFDQVQRVTDWFQHNITELGRFGTLLPVSVSPESGTSYGSFTFGGMADSYYEYLIKEYQLLGGRLEQYKKMYSDAIDDAKRYLFYSVQTVPDTPLLIPGSATSYSYSLKLEHLACFTGGMLGLGAKLLPERQSDILEARHIAESCYWSYNSSMTGIGPEDQIFYKVDDNDRFEYLSGPGPDEQDFGQGVGTVHRGAPRGSPQIGVARANANYHNRPETIESIYYMWRITGDAAWQERGWQMFASWVTHSMTESGFSGIYDVNQVPVYKTDSMESFTLAETFKYYYLLFSPPSLISLDVSRALLRSIVDVLCSTG